MLLISEKLEKINSLQKEYLDEGIIAIDDFAFDNSNISAIEELDELSENLQIIKKLKKANLPTIDKKDNI